MRWLLWLTLILISFPALAEDVPDAYRSTGYPLPRFAAVASDKVYVRAGPGMKYPILWVFEKKDYPVEIILEFDTWRKVRGHDGEEGWVHSSLLSGKRTAYVTGEEPLPLHKSAQTDSAVVAMLKPGVIADIKECEGEACKLAVSGYKGWAERKLIWGVYASENLN
ncbi:MAG: SH3 domain-containing protein [Alphaproteobacteria bacterium]|nr:SH3 domain-containing protein [Alphaproteobacteria bacterium]MCD8520553.1 SH3 domain-containing protein [Alphaproteobacteria bacterium]MCD8526189.1 SH3 domain-containing protein [Alphaproteobacteria bacterium]MCD8571232.1 SH3 domain-containing protein [Alphaproteobacteria bacterium]